MSATMLREKSQLTMPADIVEAAGLHKSDWIDWRFEGGEIRGRRLMPETAEEIDLGDVDPITLLPRGAKITAESIVRAVRADREGK